MRMRLGKEFAIDIPELHFRFTPYHKFSVILGESGRGKSYIADLIGNNAFFTEMRRFAAVWDLALITVKNDLSIINATLPGKAVPLLLNRFKNNIDVFPTNNAN